MASRPQTIRIEPTFRILREPRLRRALTIGGAVAAIAGLAVLVVARNLVLPPQQFADLGDFQLHNGSVITNLSLGYRTAGRLNAARSNAVLMLPWFQGTSRDMAWHVGREKLVDSSAYFIVMVDAIGNGVSTSPSNSAHQRNAAFPRFTISDMVRSQHRLLTETLQITQLRAVVGTSMGGMQAFEWMVAYPGFADKTVSIVGSPQTQPDDVQRWQDGLPGLQTPASRRVWQKLSGGRLREAWSELRLRPYDQMRQADAIMVHDIARHVDGSLARAAGAVRTKLLVVSTWSDREVNPKPAFDLAKLTKSQLLELDGRCGHQAPSCERAVLWPAVRRFVDE